MSKPYTLDELLAIAVAREIHDYENVVMGVGVPITAGALAKALFAPHATLMMESGIVDIRSSRYFLATNSPIEMAPMPQAAVYQPADSPTR